MLSVCSRCSPWPPRPEPTEDQPYFALSSGSTFGSNGKPVVIAERRGTWMRSSFVSTASNDPVKFFSSSKTRTTSEATRRARRTSGPCSSKSTRWKRDLRRGFGRPARPVHRISQRAFREPVPTPAPQPRPPRKPATPKRPCSTRSNWCCLSSIRCRAKSGGSGRPWPFPSRIKASIWWRRSKDLRAYTILMVSDTAMITKAGKGGSEFCGGPDHRQPLPTSASRR